MTVVALSLPQTDRYNVPVSYTHLTGGFTDCMLQNGAVKVYAVDVGYGQLAWSLRTDERVVNMERTNIRNVKPEAVSYTHLDVYKRQATRWSQQPTALF